MKYISLLAAAMLSLVSAAASAQPPLELYGGLPYIRSMAISPDGTRLAFMRDDGQREIAVVFDLASGEYFAALNTENIKTHGVYFATHDIVILRASETTMVYGYRGEFEFTAAFAWDIDGDKIKQLLRYEEDLYPAQSGLGQIVGRQKDTDYVFMPAYTGRGDRPPKDLLRVDLKKGYVRTHERGRHETIDWLVAEDGSVVAREDFDEDEDVYSIWIYEDDKPRKIYEEETDIPQMSLLGMKADRSALIVAMTLGETGREAIFALTPDGKFSEPLFSRPDVDVENVITSTNRVVHGVRYSGLYPSYEFFDPELNELMIAAAAYFPDAAVDVEDWTNDFSHLILHVSGGRAAPAYYVFDVAQKLMLRFDTTYKDLKDEDVGHSQTMAYKARDGESLTGILTLPPGAALKAGHPTIIMPHGGPSSYDGVGFDWMAQFFASRGYAVIQPNFRGSSGFGRAFELAGHGEWGRGVMQHDVTDVVNAAIKTGIADPERICIVGASYGGYAALAGGAFTPELYKCVAAFAPVADLRRMILDEERDQGKKSAAVSYWTDAIGDRKEERNKLEDISPSNYADAFTAPVLLIHGNDDTVVPIHQSRIMRRALEQAGKDVEFVTLKGGDHWLTMRDTRLETLRALDAFVTRHIGGEPVVASAH